MPYVYTCKLRELGETLGLDPSLMDVADIRTPALREEDDSSRATENIGTLLSMGVGKLRGLNPAPRRLVRIEQKALVVGGGIAGMTAALAIADHGFEVDLVEKAADLGGNLRCLQRTLEGDSPQELLEETVGKVEGHPKIRVHRRARVLHSVGRVGCFSTVIEEEDGSAQTLRHAVAVLATGGKEAGTKSYGYGQSEAVLTQQELEQKFADGSLNPEDLANVAMIQCVDSREEPRNYCSRVCCSAALKNALYLKEQNPNVRITVYYRDMMAYGFMETYYTEARRAGVVFIPYRTEDKPRVSVVEGKPRITAVDPILGREMVLQADLLVLGTGIIPNDTEELAGLFGLEIDRDGFFQEADYKWRPVDFLREGVFTAGIAHSPRSVTESVAMAQAAAQRCLRILSSDRLAASHVVAEVRHSLCSLCERCVSACPYGARMKDEEEARIIVDELMCQGCGSCAAVCPNSASVLRGFEDGQVFEVIDAALETAL
jgi:heterodisulfide reductase subunit A